MATLIKNTIRFIIRRPLVSLGLAAVTLIILVSIVSSLGGDEPVAVDNPQTPNPTQPQPQPSPSPPADLAPGETPAYNFPRNNPVPTAVYPAPDPVDDPSSEIHADIEAQLASQPLVQHLPVQKKNISVDLTDISPDGKVVLTVTYTGSLAAAKNTWQKLLSQHKDPGTAYLVVYDG